MAGYTHPTNEHRQCGAKTPFDSEAEALEDLDRLRRAPMVQAAHKLRTYLCDVCGSWHVGHLNHKKKTNKTEG